MARDIDAEFSKLFQFIFIKESRHLDIAGFEGFPGTRSPDQDEFPDHDE
jgi:hypothetical protein